MRDEGVVIATVLGALVVPAAILLAVVVMERRRAKRPTRHPFTGSLDWTMTPIGKPLAYIKVGNRVQWEGVKGRVEELSPSGHMATVRCDDGTVRLLKVEHLTRILEWAA